MKTWLLLAFVLFGGHVLAAEPGCVRATLRFDSTLTIATVESRDIGDAAPVAFPNLAVPTLRDMVRGAGVGDGGVVTPTAGQRLELDFGRQPRKVDRQYTPFIRFGDGSLALFSPALAARAGGREVCWTIRAPRGPIVAWGKTHAHRVRLAPGAGRTYLLLGKRAERTTEQYALFLDDTLPPWVRAASASLVDDAMTFYAERTGRLRERVVVAVTAEPEDFGRSGGDALQRVALIRIKGKTWSTETPALRAMLEQTIGHELFHQWNAYRAEPKWPGDALLVHEGGAELAAVLWRHARGSMSRDDVAGFVSRNINQCVVRLEAGQSVAEIAAGNLVYTCGTVVATLASLAAAGSLERAGTSYFTAWQALGDQGPHPYALDDAVSRLAGAASGAAAGLLTAVRAKQGFGEHTRAALERAGAALTATAAPDPDTHGALASRLTVALMGAACNGAYGFFTEDASIVLDGAIDCPALPRGGELTHVLGEPVIARAPQAYAAAHRACVEGGSVTITFARDGDRTIRCAPDTLAAPPQLLDVVLP